MRFLKDYFYIITLLSITNETAAAKIQPKIATHPIANTILTQFSDAYGRKSKKYIAPLIIKSVGPHALTSFCSKKINALDVYVTSKKLTPEDLVSCSNEGINDFIELRMGFGAIIALASPELNLKNISQQDLYKIVAKFDYKNDITIPNATQIWHDVSKNGDLLTSAPILVFVPRKASSLRDIFEDRILASGCQTRPGITKIRSEKPKLYKELCLDNRSDNVLTEVNLSDKDSTPLALLARKKGIITFAPPSALLQTELAKNLVAINGFKPTIDMIKSEKYPLSAPIYLYVKVSSLKASPGLRSFLKYIYSMQNKDHSALDSSGYMPPSPEEMAEQFHLIMQGKANYRLDEPKPAENTTLSPTALEPNWPDTSHAMTLNNVHQSVGPSEPLSSITEQP
ncbi:PstS family phosphate ABC transporter substrate-binding protein [Candidatus Odyssella acanthamoebae]|uniref:PBP domain-containing protein n=1 Tax=Candidatus Odyssella acanthamoebae TaxID=91604 RepID=A0A077AVE5_9PROT|nr:substrate-binding domain-containing protein [Candidatus Paracaedibacter acanthamoebae]AIK96009.1 hypothetical protein ID47_03530 [Candidatus Paracaedibacter acanthamoebae]